MDRAEIEKFIDDRIEKSLQKINEALVLWGTDLTTSGSVANLKILVSKKIKEVALDAVLYATSQPKRNVEPSGPIQGYCNDIPVGPAIDLGITLTEDQQASINTFVTYWAERSEMVKGAMTGLLSDARAAGNDKHMRLIDAQNVVRKCRAQFEFYRQQHLEKNPPDTVKAERNQILRDMCDTVLPEIAGVATTGPKILSHGPFKYWPRSQKISHWVEDFGDMTVIDIRGWGYLTGGAALKMDPDQARAEQDAFGEWVAALLNSTMPPVCQMVHA
jgi:hypothetical protein